jgi:phosphosulfolactate phosphohydrolase-like enzyme
MLILSFKILNHKNRNNLLSRLGVVAGEKKGKGIDNQDLLLSPNTVLKNKFNKKSDIPLS